MVGLPHLRLPEPHLFSGQESFCVYLSFGVYLSLWVSMLEPLLQRFPHDRG